MTPLTNTMLDDGFGNVFTPTNGRYWRRTAYYFLFGLTFEQDPTAESEIEPY